ncbi:rhamnan synthesis F family protein [Marimonas arenosa]|uniref:Glycosyltransferase n=1 Tax=Marimonas arenosa TaxID=1795305 RepID=A0AAE4B6M7_9RHOB|nr:rhamnan synthesis F family protein [Marimonas arenosa]MDQ2092272.1 glycosyltransferase [Marimonas arenosa]
MTLRQDERDISVKSQLFDSDWYRNRYPDVRLSGIDPVRHYLSIGAQLGRDPGPDFSTAGYLRTYLDVAARGENPLVHFERHGRGERRNPRPKPRPPATGGRGGLARVDVVVPVYNALDDVRACLESLAHCPTGFDLRVLVVNDGSDAPTTDWLRSACSTLDTRTARFELIEHNHNKGYTKAVNTGLLASDAPYVVTLNSDTIVTPHWLDGLVRCMNSAPDIGITGPLSNAASWQNVPELRGPDGGFAINALPEGIQPDDMAAVILQSSQRVYPRSTFLNGFCFMIRREVLDAIGYMDEAAFPTGYGEENDFCIRAQDAGFALAIADDTYVFHAKSKSFGSTRREELSKAGGEALRAKHSAEKFRDLVEQVARTEVMDAVRRRIRRYLGHFQMTQTARAADLTTSQKVLFLMPVGGGGGGANSVVQEAAAMRRIGVDARIAVFVQDFDGYQQQYADVDSVANLFVTMQDETLVDLAAPFDVVIATFHSSVPRLERIVAAHPHILPAYYAQDYEPLFYDDGSTEREAALASYTTVPGCLVFAKTDWICHQIETNHDTPVHKVAPSIDEALFHPPGGRPLFDPGCIRIAAMIRPSTPRRGAGRTMEVLAGLKQRFGEGVAITIYGCAADDPAFEGLKTDFAFENRGVLTRPQVATMLQVTDVHVDLSDYQAFGRTGLEAMACGAAAVVPRAGGCGEYAVDGVNALVVDSLDPNACGDAIAALVKDRDRLARMRLSALHTAAGYTANRAALSELTLFAQELAARRDRRDAPEPETAADNATTTALSAAQSPEDLSRFPLPAFAEKGYQLELDPSSPALVLPYEAHSRPQPLPSMNVGIQLHLHYVDLLPEFTHYLRNVPGPFHLYVSVPAPEHVNPTAAALRTALPKATVKVKNFENRGRDIGPFLAGFGRDLAQHDYVCHIHSKRSPHNPAKQDWRAQLMTNLMGSRAIVSEIFRLFEYNPHLGMVFPEYHWSLAEQISWGTNFDACVPLAKTLGISISPDHLDLFPAGSMFWARGAALANLFALDLSFEDFPEEAAQVDGTVAHAVERLLGTIVVQAGYKLQQVRSSKPHDLLSYYTAQWPFHDKSAAELATVVAEYRAAHVPGHARIGLLCANAGGYDATVVHEHLDPGIDYHLVVDQPTEDKGFWIIHPMTETGSNGTDKARAVKTNPFPFLGDCDIGIWIDANVLIRSPLDRYLEMVRANPDIPIFGIPHPHRRCIFDEAKTVSDYNKADPAKVRAQMDLYAKDGYPKQNGLIESNLLMFNLRHPEIEKLFALWREQITSQTHRDQLSLNYALWKLGLDWMPLMSEGKNLRTEPEFAYFGHGGNSGYTPVSIPGSQLVDPATLAEERRKHA